MSELNLSATEIDYIFSPAAIRAQAKRIFDLTVQGKTSFAFHESKLESASKYVLDVIHKKYPKLDIPFHSRWGHFRAGGFDRTKKLNQLLSMSDASERARAKLDLVITSVLLDAGAGAEWSYFDNETQTSFGRSEGLGLASFSMFLSGAMSLDHESLRADGEALIKVTPEQLKKHFQVTDDNPLIGIEGRASLMNGLALAVLNKKMFRDGRPGNIFDYLVSKYGDSITAPQILRAVLDGFGKIWPGRISSGNTNLGDVWRYSKFQGGSAKDALVPFHKLSQWMTYSLIEPIAEANIRVTGVENLTGLAEYRNGGLMIDSGLITLNNPEDAEKKWEPSSDLIIEWRALTIHLLDLIGERVQKALKKTPAEFPLAKVLEGGTWWAGRYLAQEKRQGGTPPLDIKSDGTVF